MTRRRVATPTPMRAPVGLFVAFVVLLGPAVGAASQDEVLAEYASYGDDDLFAQYPALLFLKLTVSNRLQTGQVPAAELAQIEAVLVLLKEIDRLHGQVGDLDRGGILDGLGDCKILRSNIADLQSVDQYKEILNLTAARVTRAYVQEAERFLPSIGRTTERLSLLGLAVDASNEIQDGLAYSRLSQLEADTQADYDADSARARAAVDGARNQLATVPYAYSLEFPRHYASLFSTRDELGVAAVLFQEHGETENAAEARALQDAVNARIRSLGTLITGVVLLFLLAIVGLGVAALSRVVRWSQHRHRAGLGDELAVEVT